eukprot:GFKZ01006886.1.p1 GENE.GFKZ01006886.1~~GFKZ01006886.1.p1  ORF type:complete len:523 (+),score=69.64 GFKZ01006886.1:122-1570(+)
MSPNPPTLLHSLNTPTLRSLTGSELMHTSPVPNDPHRFLRSNILVFRAASGEEQPISPRPSSPASDDTPHMPVKPRISSVTDSLAGSPDRTHPDVHDHSHSHSPVSPVQTPTSHAPIPDMDSNIIDDDSASTYSHASAINLDDLDDDDIAGLRSAGLSRLHGGSPRAVHRRLLESNRQSFANSFAKARQVARSRKAVVVARQELQPHNRAPSLTDRCVGAIAEVLDMNAGWWRAANDRFIAFSALYTKDEKMVIGEFLKESGSRLKNDNLTPWRSPLHMFGGKAEGGSRALIKSAGGNGRVAAAPGGSASNSKVEWRRGFAKSVIVNDNIVRSVVFGSHVVPSVQTAESVLLRMAGVYHREEVTRRTSRAERLDVPLSFAMTLTGTLATFARLECSANYKRYRSRSAANRKSNPQALIVLKTKYDGLKLSFAVSLHGDSPCTVLFRRPRIFSPRKIDDYATLVTEAKDILAEFGREVGGSRG